MGRPKLNVRLYEKYGSLTVTSEAFKRPPCRYYYVTCKCDCGNTDYFKQADLKAGTSFRCNECADRSRRKVQVGDRFGNWKVIEETKDADGKLEWVCKCKCGRTRRIKTGLLRAKNMDIECWECAALTKRTGVDGTLWGTIKRNAEARDLEVAVDWEFCKALLKKQEYRCALSGVLIWLPDCTSQVLDNMGTASLDRIDSRKGYLPGNVQWVHKDYNILKMDWDEKDFIAMCCAVADHFRSMSDDVEPPPPSTNWSAPSPLLCP
jgi:hypothetical protein